MAFYTDYPFTGMGDIPNHIAPIREIELLYYDTDKYVGVKVVGTDFTDEIKWGYVYTTPRRFDELPDSDARNADTIKVYDALRKLPSSY